MSVCYDCYWIGKPNSPCPCCRDFSHYMMNRTNRELKLPKTHGDRIRAMSDEELAELFEMIPHSGNPATYTIDGFCIDDGLKTKRQWLDWLREEEALE